MLKKVITYTDYDDVQRTEGFYFNLTQTEIIEMEYDIDGGMEKMLKEVAEKLDGKRIMAFVKKIILKAYGEKSPDGKRFVKSEEIAQAFYQTPAYDKLFVEMVTDSKKLSEFVNGVIPKVDKVDKPAESVS